MTVGRGGKRRSQRTHYVIIVIIKNRFAGDEGTVAGFSKLFVLQQIRGDSWKRGIPAAFVQLLKQHVPSESSASSRALCRHQATIIMQMCDGKC